MQFRRNVYCGKALGTLEVWERYMEEAHEDEKMFENIENEKKVGNKRAGNVGKSSLIRSIWGED